MKIHIRNAVLEDAKAIADAHVSAWHKAYRGIISDQFLDEKMTVENGESVWQMRLNQKPVDTTKNIFLVAEKEGQVIAFACAGEKESSNQSLYLKCLYVHPKHWRSGAGTQLFETVKLLAKERGFKEVYLHVLSENYLGRDFYDKMGGEPVESNLWKCSDGNVYPDEKYVFKLSKEK